MVSQHLCRQWLGVFKPLPERLLTEGNEINIHPINCATVLLQWPSCQIRKIVGCAGAGKAGNVSLPPRFSDPNMHHGTCVTHVPWCMPGLLTCCFLWSWRRGKRSRLSRCMRNLQFYVTGKRPMLRYSSVRAKSMIYSTFVAVVPHTTSHWKRPSYNESRLYFLKSCVIYGQEKAQMTDTRVFCQP